MFFPANSMVSITEITRRFRVNTDEIEKWMREGILPKCTWFNGNRYWSSNELNDLIAGCTFALKPTKTPAKKSAPSDTSRININWIALGLVLALLLH